LYGRLQLQDIIVLLRYI